MGPKSARNQAIAARSAALSISGVKIPDQVELLSQEFNIPVTRTMIENIRRGDVFKEILKKHKELIIATAVQELKLKASDLVPDVLQAIKEGLQNGNMQSAALALKILGIGEHSSAPTTSNEPLTVILPGRAHVTEGKDEPTETPEEEGEQVEH